MHNAMYPGSAKFQTRPASPQFANFSPPADYPPHGSAAASGQVASALGPGPHQHNHSMSMRHHPKTMASKSRSASGHHMVNSSTMSGMMSGAGSLGHHRGDLIFPDDMDSIEFCMPPPPAPSNGIGHGVNGEMLLLHGGNNGGMCSGEAFTERRRRGHSRRSNHKMDVEQQVKWSRKNIAATMERFEPTSNNHSSSSTSSLEYGFAASVVTPSTTPSHPAQMSPAPQSFANGAAAPLNHVYSYAYYEPGAAKCHTNIPHKEGPALPGMPAPEMAAGPSKSPPRNSIRALLAKSFRSKSNSGQSTSSSPSADDRHTYTTRYGTTENLYEEVNDQKIRKVLSDNRIASSAAGNVKEELRRVQHNHFRVLDELNLSLEALIMPPTPPDISPNPADDDEPSTSAAAAAAAAAAATTALTSTASAAAASQRPRRGGLLGGASSSSSTSSQQRTLSQASLENLSTTLNCMELKEHTHSSCINPEFDEGDLDSGFSGSGSSSGASYNESLRYYKTGTKNIHPSPQQQQQQQQLQLQLQQQQHTLPHNLSSCRSSTASGTSTSKSSMASSEDQGIGMLTALGGCGGAAAMASNGILASPFNYARRCSDTQRASARSVSASSATGTKPKKNFWTIKP